MDNATAQRIAHRFIGMSNDQRRLVLEKMNASGQNFRLLPIVETRYQIDRIPLSYAQQRLFFLWYMEPDSARYNITLAVRLRGRVDRVALEQALQILQQRHEVLRTRFVSIEDQWYQYIDSHPSINVPCIACTTQAELDTRVAEELHRPFDLIEGPVLRMALFIMAPDDQILTLCTHHVVSDGWSTQILLQELVHCYEAIHAGRKPELPALPIQYADFSLWQCAWMDAGEAERQLSYWTECLAGEQSLLELPFDRERPATLSSKGAILPMEIPRDLATSLKALARQRGQTLYMLVLAITAVMLSRQSGQSDIRIAAPCAGRNRWELEGLVGCFANTQVLRIEVDERQPFSELLDQVKKVVAGAQAHQELPFEQLVDSLVSERSLSHNPLVQFKLNQHVNGNITRGQAATLSGLIVEDYGDGLDEAHFDLALDFTDTSEGIDAYFTYATDLFDAASVERFAKHWLSILRALLEANERPLLEQTVQHVAMQVTPTTATTPDILALWAHGLQRSSRKPALQVADQWISFHELEVRSNRLGWRLQKLGVGPGQRAALILERSIDWVVSLLAVLKTGAAYLPLDPTQPSRRLQHILDDSGVVLALLACAETHSGLRVQRVDLDNGSWRHEPSEPLAVAVEPQFPAYVIYTSGSTGNPKGVEVSHGAVARYTSEIMRRLALPDDAHLAITSSVAADLGNTLLFSALAGGFTLHLIPPELAFDPDRFAAYMDKQHIDALKIVPSHLQGLLQAENPTAVLPARILILGGEVCPKSLAEHIAQLKPDCRLMNHYGPTETTVGVLSHEVNRLTDRHSGVPLGNALPGTQIWILDTWLNSCDEAVAGELYIGGDQLAHGYIGRAALTAERFVPALGGSIGARMYRTGDRVRQRNGGVEFCGRVDDQVKIRGYRVEPGEITRVLRGLDGVRAAVVLALPLANDKTRLQLVGYCVTDPGIDATSLQQALASLLPDYLVPSHILLLDSLPLTTNGKLDRRALPSPQEQAKTYIGPSNETESILANIWAQVLKREQVGVIDNFFEIGGDSILSLQIIARAKRNGLKITPKQLFEQQTIVALAPLVERIASNTPIVPIASPSWPLEDEQLRQIGLIPESLEDCLELSPMQQGMLYHSLLEDGRGSYVNQIRLDAEALNVTRLTATWQMLIDKHSALRTNFITAFETACQVIHKHMRLPLLEVDWQSLEDLPERLDRLAREQWQRGFDLQGEPLLRLAVVRTAPNRHHVMLTYHHILLDGWSLSFLFGQVLEIYAGAPLSIATGQPRDYIEWLRRQDRQAEKAFWKAELALLGEPTRLAQAMRVPNSSQGNGHAKHQLLLDPVDYEELVTFSQTKHVTLNTLLQAAWLILLQHWTGQHSVAFGTTVAGRPSDLHGIEEQVGLFINTLPVIESPDPTQRLDDWLDQVQRHNIALREYEYTSLSEIQQWAGSGGESLFDSLLVVENYPVAEAFERRIEDSPRFFAITGNGATHFPMVITAEMGKSLHLSFDYDRRYFDSSTIRRMADQLHTLLLAFPKSEREYLGNLPVASMLPTLKAKVDYDQVSLHRLFQSQAERTPNNIALIFGSQQMSYQELDIRSNRLARCLRLSGVGHETRVVISLERSLEMVIGLLAILKAGGAYVPVDPALPDERLAYLLQDSNALLLLTQARLSSRLDRLFSGQILCLDQSEGWLETFNEGALSDETDPANLAYVIYTSGSTGQPKGVAVSHSALVNHMQWMQGQLALVADDKVLQKTSFGFDASGWELWLPLLTGATCVLAKPELDKDISLMESEVLDQDITVLQLVPSVMGALLPTLRTPQDFFGSLRHLCFGGEALPVALVREVVGQGARQLWNLYGPTETTIDATCLSIGDLNSATLVPIGTAIDNLSVWIVGPNLAHNDQGIGELLIGGVGLARGYLGRPALTAESFVPDPFGAPGARLYRTGDLGRLNEVGGIDYMGRRGQQVKIRGYRVELDEIRERLQAHASVRESAVLTTSQGQLVGYVVPCESALLSFGNAQEDWFTTLRAYLKSSLPNYMVPTALVAMEQIPLTLNGKLDKNALLAISVDRVYSFHNTPRTRLEQQLAAIWEKVLGVDRVGLTDNFFELGGHSLLALRLISEVKAQFGHYLKLSDFIRWPTLEQQVWLIRGELSRDSSVLVRLNSSDESFSPVFCFHPAGGNPYCYYPLAIRLERKRPFYGLLNKAYVEPGWVDESWDSMVTGYLQAIREVQPQGPYSLLGWSLGGALAMDVAARFEQAGEIVDFLGLADPTLPAEYQAGAIVDDYLSFDSQWARLTDSERASAIRLRAFFPGLDEVKLVERLLALKRDVPLESQRVTLLLEWVASITGTPIDLLRQVQEHNEAALEILAGQDIISRNSTLLQSFLLQPLRVRPELWWASVGRSAKQIEEVIERLINAGIFQGPVSSHVVPCSHNELIYAPLVIEQLYKRLLTNC